VNRRRAGAPTPRHARGVALAAASVPAGDRTALAVALKAALESGRAAALRALAEGATGSQTVARLTRLADGIVQAAFAHAVERAFHEPNPTAGERLAVLATGGYGRRELAPFSDVDLLFLIPYKPTPWVEQVVEFVLHVLWDAGLKVGHATRSVEECLARARGDLTIRTALLETRRVCGDAELARTLERRFRREAVEADRAGFVAGKLAERAARHARVGDALTPVEPNVKEGVGGLRDLHFVLWTARILKGVRSLEGLAGAGLTTLAEQRRLVRARERLLTVRCHLHAVAGRAEERLTFDVQPLVARALGYGGRNRNRAVERFMKRTFRAAKEVADLVGPFAATLARGEGAVADPRALPPLGPGELADVGVDGPWLALRRTAALRERPAMILRLFRMAHERGLELHPATLRAVRSAAARHAETLRADPSAAAVFMDILATPDHPERVLRRMNEAGVLGRFVPDFGRIVAQMQYDRYHAYTVDEHTIRAVGGLAAIDRGEHADALPLATAVFPKVQSRRALYLAMFVHDIAKGRGGDHSELGAAVARALALRLGLSEEEAETAGWLVEHHLLFSVIAFKRDVEDPKTVADFVAVVQSLERLRLLLILTVADIRATSPAIWNGWKGQLLRDLYNKAEEVLTGGHQAEHKHARVAALQALLRQALPRWSEERFAAYVERHVPPYWLSYDSEAHLRHARLVARADAAADGRAVDWRVDTFRDVTELTVATPDKQGLFATIAGAIAAAGASIADARIMTLKDGLALDTFWIQDHARRAFAEEARLEKLAALVGRAIDGRVDLDREVAKRRRPAWAEKAGPPVVARVLIDNEASSKHTVIEVNGRDRPGLLYGLTRVLTDLKLSIVTARVNTFGERVVDTFYVRDRFGLKLTATGPLARLRQRLLAVLADAPAA